MVDISGFNPETGEWNDSLTGDFIWNNTNIGEALSLIVTPFTWSLVGGLYELMDVLPGYHSAGNIGGRPYQNATMMFLMLTAMRKNPRQMARELGNGGELPEGFTIPIPKLSRYANLTILWNAVRLGFRMNAALRRCSKFVVETPSWCRKMRIRLQAVQTKVELLTVWKEIYPYTAEAFWQAMSTAWRYGETVGRLRNELVALVGPADANLLLSNVSRETDTLASLGPVLGLSRVAQGEMDRNTYIDLYGHRGPYEAECSVPRPAEDPTWLDQQLAAFTGQDIDVAGMLAMQGLQFEHTWERFSAGFPKISTTIRRRLDQAAEMVRQREAARSELSRLAWVGRTWALQAGKLTGLGEDIFHLTFDEILDLLAGKEVPVDNLQTRKHTYAQYQGLPNYPSLISGQFNPFQWASDPDHRIDYFDSHVPKASAAQKPALPDIITGSPGSGGYVEGLVRRLDSPAEGASLQQGEILVTSQTDIGWTLLFPRLAAVVTDVGAPLSHAAIVARELGIPAVVGCGNATQALHTGDRVAVDGSNGKVTRIR